jgi:hypothetical protein
MQDVFPTGALVVGVGVSVSLYYAFSAAVARLFPAVPARDRERASHATVCFAHNVYVSVAALRVLPLSLLLGGGPELWHLRIDGFGTIAGMSAGFFVYDLCMCPLWQPPASPMLVVHHACASRRPRAAPRLRARRRPCERVAARPRTARASTRSPVPTGVLRSAVSILCWLCSAWVGFAQPWITYCLVTELSSIFLSARSVALALIPADEAAQSAVVSATTAVFGVSFLVIRTLPIPLLARSWLRQPPLGAAACGLSRVANALGWMSALPLLFNLFWSHLLIQKARSGGGKVKAAQARSSTKD